MTKKSAKIFHTELAKGVYQLSSAQFGHSLAPGGASRNSYLIVGEKEAILFDLALEEPELKEYVEALAGKPIKLVLSHAHIDHIYNIGLFDEVWLHPADERLLHEGSFFQPPISPCPALHYLSDGERADLGGRVLELIHIPGHTDGSVVLLDGESGILLGGDSCTRRLLYGLHGFVPLECFCKSLRGLLKREFSVIYSAHDRCALPREHLDLMIDCLTNDFPKRAERIEIPALGEALCYSRGDENELQYFDIAMPAKCILREEIS